jgi:hypothetical protein
MISQLTRVKTGDNFESVARLWLCNKKYGVINTITSAVCWSLEAKECYLFPGCCLARDENALAKSSLDVKMLEALDPA